MEEVGWGHKRTKILEQGLRTYAAGTDAPRRKESQITGKKQLRKNIRIRGSALVAPPTKDGAFRLKRARKG